MSDTGLPSAYRGLERKDYYCLAGLCGLLLLIYAKLWIPGLVLIKRDAFQAFLPLKQYIYDRLASGELPQWFPYEGLGRPLIGLTAMGIFHPFTALYWLLPTQDAYRVSTLLSCLLAVVGAFVLCRTLGISRTGSSIAAIGFSCSGYVMSLTENLEYLYSMGVLPLFMCTLERMLKEKKRSWIAWSALLWASVFLNGDVQTGYYYGFIAIVWVALRGMDTRLQQAGRLVGVVVLTALLAAIQLAPAWVTYGLSSRAATDSYYDEAIHWSTHPLRLPLMGISPTGNDAESSRVAQVLFRSDELGRGATGLWAESLYLGIPILGLACIGVWCRRELLACTVIGTLALLLALGHYGGLYGLFYQWIPFWSAFRFPEKLMGVVMFACAVLAGGGYDVIRRNRVAVRIWFGCALVLLIASAPLFSEAAVDWCKTMFRMSEGHARHVATTTGWAIICSALATAGMGFATVWGNCKPEHRRWVSITVVLLISLDLARANLPTIHTTSSEMWTFTPGFVAAIRRDAKVDGPGHVRLLSNPGTVISDPRGFLRGLTPREIVALYNRHALFLEHNATYHIEGLQCYLPGQSFIFDQVGMSGDPRLIARYNVGYLIGRSSQFSGADYAGSSVAEISDHDLALVRNPSPVTPRAYLSKRPRALQPNKPVFSFLQGEEFLSGEVDGLEGVPGPLPEGGRTGQVSVLEYRPEVVRIAVNTPNPAVLVLADAFEPGWTARLEEGNELPIYRANGLVRAVSVPAGTHQVVFQYETPLLRAGAWLSLMGLIMCLVLIVTGQKTILESVLARRHETRNELAPVP